MTDTVLTVVGFTLTYWLCVAVSRRRGDVVEQVEDGELARLTRVMEGRHG